MADNKQTDSKERYAEIKKKHSTYHQTYISKFNFIAGIIIFLLLITFAVNKVKSYNEKKREIPRITQGQFFRDTFEVKRWNNIVLLKKNEKFTINIIEKKRSRVNWGKNKPIRLKIEAYNDKGEYVETFVEGPNQQNIEIGHYKIVKIYSEEGSFKLGYNFK